MSSIFEFYVVIHMVAFGFLVECVPSKARFIRAKYFTYEIKNALLCLYLQHCSLTYKENESFYRIRDAHRARSIQKL